MLRKILAVAVMGLLGTAFSIAQTFTVTSPTAGSFIGLNNQIKFNINGATLEVRVDVVATGPGGVQFTNTGRFTPDGENRINDQLPLNFSQGSPEGDYTIVVTATEPGNTYTPVTINVTLDVTKPKFLQFNPVANTFVNGIVPIRVSVLEPNFRDYRVQVDGQDIPNNTGTVLTGGEFVVNWDTTGIEFDGTKTISIRLRDQAENEENRSFEVILDRVSPVVAVVQPRSDVLLAAKSNVSVAIDIFDGNPSSVHISGVDVVARKLDGTFLDRVAVQSFRNTGGNTNRWTGRLRYKASRGKTFKLVVTVLDRAGNPATVQEVIVKYR